MPPFELSYTADDSSAALYTLEQQSTACWTAFYLANQAIFPDEIEFVDSFYDPSYQNAANQNQNGGVYLFAPAAPSVPEDFLAALRTLLTTLQKRQQNKAYRFMLWIEDADASTLEASSIPFNYSSAAITVPLTSGVSLLPYTFALTSGVSIAVNATGDGLEFDAFNGSMRFEIDGNPAGESISSAGISFDPTADIGVIAFSQALIVGVGAEMDWEALGVGLHFYAQGADQVLQQTYPVLIEPADSAIRMVGLSISMDPLNAQDIERSRITFDRQFLWQSGFRTVYGDAVDLLPEATDTGLAFTLGADPAGTESPWYALSPFGAFHLHLHGQTPDYTEVADLPMLMGGLSGTEGFRFQPAGTSYAGDVMTFVPGKPAFAPVFPLDSDSEDSEDKLTDTCTTSWISLAPATDALEEDLYYFAQPEDAALYTFSSTGNSGLLDYLVIPATMLGEELSFPMGAYGGISTSTATSAIPAAEVAEFEFQILNPSRKESIIADGGELGRRPMGRRAVFRELTRGAAQLSAVTPQGFVAKVQQNGSWDQLRIAQNTVTSDSGSGPVTRTYDLQFLNLTDKMRLAMQTNQQFLVITDPTNLGEMGRSGSIPDAGQAIFNNVMSIAGWEFEINVGGGDLGNYNNVLLFKFAAGSIADLAQNPAGWTQPEDFNSTENNGVNMVSLWLGNYIADARSRYETGDTNYEHFIDIVDDPNWNGVLALNLDISLENFPIELKALIAGVDLSQFRAHHFGIEMNQVNSDLELEADSSLFGLVDYVDVDYALRVAAGKEGQPMGLPAGTDAYYFKMLDFYAKFSNSQMADFSSLSQLTMKAMFGEEVKSISSQSEVVSAWSVLLEGKYVKVDGQGTYNFVQSTYPATFALESNVLEYVTIKKTQFDTMSADSAASNPFQVVARFSFSGYLSFQALEDFDVFSFGVEAGASALAKGLYFQGLQLTMDFDFRTPSEASFVMDTSDLHFDPGKSTARAGSLFQNFPVDLDGFVQNDLRSPEDLGYLPTSIAYTTSGLSSQWYGLRYNLNLGSGGSLASSAGFNVQMLIAWSPKGSESTQPAFAIYMTLPGTNHNRKLFELQGVIKVSVEEIELLLSDDATPAWLLKLTGIALKILVAKIPPSGSIDFFLFGDPDQQGKSTDLGWYLGYNQTTISLNEGDAA